MLDVRSRHNLLVRSVAVLMSTLPATACNESSGNLPPTYEPVSGVWNYTNEGLVSNTCGADDLYTDPSTEFYLTNSGDGTFTVLQQSEDNIDCSMSADAFVCPPGPGGSVDLEELSITVTWELGFEGTFSSATAMSGIMRVPFTCSGEACGLVSSVGITFPCAYEYAFSATKA